jgi:hypothetical protein
MHLEFPGSKVLITHETHYERQAITYVFKVPARYTSIASIIRA